MGIFDWLKGSSGSFESTVENAFHSNVKTAVKSCQGNSMLAGVMIYSTIAKTYDTLKRDSSLQQKSSLSFTEYDAALRRIMNKVGRKYLSNWDQMQMRNEMEEQQRLEDEAIGNFLAGDF